MFEIVWAVIEIARILIQIACSVPDMACRVVDTAGAAFEIECNEYFAASGYGVMRGTNLILSNKYS
jgi:hypothetical protein